MPGMTVQSVVNSRTGREAGGPVDAHSHCYLGAMTAGLRSLLWSARSSPTALWGKVGIGDILSEALEVVLIYGPVNDSSTYHMEMQSNRQHPGPAVSDGYSILCVGCISGQLLWSESMPAAHNVT